MEIATQLKTCDLSADFDSDLLLLHQHNPRRYPFLLESVAGSGSHGRYDILLAFPQHSLVLDSNKELYYKSHEDCLDLECPPQIESDIFLDALSNWLSQHHTAHHFEFPFSGGWFVYFAYELAQQIEPRLDLPQSKNAPTAIACRIPVAIIKDHLHRRMTLVMEESFEKLEQRVQADIKDLSLTEIGTTVPQCVDVCEDHPQIYIDSVKKIKNYIKEGDVFQVNLSRQWSVQVQGDYTDLYRSLRLHNPAPYFGLARYDDTVIMSSSPERLVRVKGNTVETRPIAGTRPTSKQSSFNDAYQVELMTNPKERAEHVMLIDLERNDLGRVCKPGTIHVNELMVLESYAHVHHIVSNIRGQLRDDVSPADIIKAVFPGGTITGCPKVRCMEIIAELEGTPRGSYTGSMGYINRDGSMDVNILIRTMTLEGDMLSLRAGAGIVADSDPEKELLETRAKAKGLLLALGLQA